MFISDPQPSGKGTSPATVPEGSGVEDGAELTLEEDLLPLVDPEVLEDLEEQLNGAVLAVRFARDYTAMWDRRYNRLAAAVENQDLASALDAVISLKITSAMVGGVRLARLAEALEQVIRQGDFGKGQSLMERVAKDGCQTVSELQATYIKNG
ncbi:Hpt domain-containing protein [Arthrobacter oryzae]|uniref:Hpt domain-containing protein n=1 Tax=Arthrobacter oryzae TaxID=409290 RepID=UPI00273B8C2D|nr:Hpt domain-containing protein [Arthrobacter oryzae]WLQ06868.1 Hpt domain-containing protein [Arthrobacter oryzae]